MFTKTTKTMVAAAAMTFGLFGVTATPANAASGGGCYDHPNTDPCISLSGNFLYADFYQNKRPDASMSTAVLAIIKNGLTATSQSYDLTRTGRYGPISNNIATLPPSNGSAYARVRVYTNTGALHYEVRSPTQYW
ncbi:hypothetical protein Sru01_44680 [Sphaerisporangium rufum]|uniref:Peptidase inhibitor family I36 n=1 Tax=Sphaerisporangium rufum TaxID=1381558 RepID=A0A919R6U3_9ACTN|nr:hypothetical protein [Sphaerisporangium rufum]GII79486.1 hypothetical protein Sru01_44680 [Sphaerisporangium rufum]